MLCVTLALYVVCRSHFNHSGSFVNYSATLFRILRDTAQDTQKTLVFTSVFVIVWVGSAVVTLNSQLLGGTLYVLVPTCTSGFELSCRKTGPRNKRALAVAYKEYTLTTSAYSNPHLQPRKNTVRTHSTPVFKAT